MIADIVLKTPKNIYNLIHMNLCKHSGLLFLSVTIEVLTHLPQFLKHTP